MNMGQADAEYHEKMMRLAQRPFTPEEEQDAMPEPLSRSDTPPDPPEPRRPMPEPLSPEREAEIRGTYFLGYGSEQAIRELLAALDAERAKNERLEAAHERCCDETDYCYVCDNHPSHGHAADCLLAEREVQE